MKYLVLIPDGMADREIPSLGGKTPMEAAHKPCMDFLCRQSFSGTVSNVPDGMTPESDTANLAILSYDPKIYSKGRSPLEAVSMGLTLNDDDVAIRCNVVTLSEGDVYEDRVMLDHSADEITTEEADELIRALNDELGNEVRRLYTGVSYRHCLIWRDEDDSYPFMRPHDIIGRRIGNYLPKDERGAKYLDFMKKSVRVLENHPVNAARRARGLNPANAAWLWSPGRKPSLPSFYDKWGLNGTVISAVDLIRGIGKCAGMKTPLVEGATGNVHTNYKGKADAAIEAFKNGDDFVYIHVEAPDECGHRAEIENKVLSIELIDELILSPAYSYLVESGDDFRIVVLPDHPTPIEIRTHSMESVPFFIYDSKDHISGASRFTEKHCREMPFYLPYGHELMSYITKERVL